MLNSLSIVDAVIFTVIAVIVSLLAGMVVIMRRSELKLIATMKQKDLNIDELESKLESYYNNVDQFVTADRDFMRFINQSRDSAFEYIESAQSGLEEIADNVAQISALIDDANNNKIEKQVTLINQTIRDLLPDNSASS